VSLLVGELSFGVGSESDDHVKVGVLAGSLIAAAIGAAILAARNRVYRRAVTAGSSTPSAGGSPD
jgi:NhaA family Na+:H+ antiporter